MTNIAGKTIIITGASGDIGSAMTRVFLAAGAKIAAIDRSEQGLNRLAREMNGDDALRTIAADVTAQNSIGRAFAMAQDAFGRIDGVVNGAGIEGLRATIDTYPVEIFQSVMAVNVTGVFLAMQLAVQLLRANGGSIVNIASTAGLKGSPNLAAYVASKHAVIGLTRVCALEWGRYGIRTNAVCPGAVEGRMIEAIYAGQDQMPALDPRERRRANPTGRYAHPDNVAEVVAFLLSDAASFVNGACYAVDGGASAG